MAEPVERRKYERRLVLMSCRVDGDLSHAAMQLTDLSEGGCFVATNAMIQTGSRITLYATMSGIEVPLSGRVVHVQPGRGFGLAIDFEDLPPGTRRRFEHLLDTEPRTTTAS